MSSVAVDKCHNPVDDLVLGGVKAHLPAIERWFFDALSQQFASFKIKGRRLSLVFEDTNVFSHVWDYYLITIRDKKGRDIAQYRFPKDTDPSPKLKALFARLFLQRFGTITIRSFDHPNGMVKKLLQATTEAALVLKNDRYPLNVRRFEAVHTMLEQEGDQCWQMWIERIAPFVRHLQIKQGIGDWQAGLMGMEAMPMVISRCQQLRTIDLHGQKALASSVNPPVPEGCGSHPVAIGISVLACSVADAISVLPHLRALRLLDLMGSNLTLPPPLPLGNLTLSGNWFQALATADRSQLAALFKKMDKLEYHAQLFSRDLSAEFDFLYSSMRRPLTSSGLLQITIPPSLYFHQFSVENVHHWMAVADKHRAMVALLDARSLPSQQAFISIHDEANFAGLMPLAEDDISQMVYKFASGGQVKLVFLPPKWRNGRTDYDY